MVRLKDREYRYIRETSILGNLRGRQHIAKARCLIDHRIYLTTWHVPNVLLPLPKLRPGFLVHFSVLRGEVGFRILLIFKPMFQLAVISSNADDYRTKEREATLRLATAGTDDRTATARIKIRLDKNITTPRNWIYYSGLKRVDVTFQAR